jgi:hypothetical protein
VAVAVAADVALGTGDAAAVMLTVPSAPTAIWPFWKFCTVEPSVPGYGSLVG